MPGRDLLAGEAQHLGGDDGRRRRIRSMISGDLTRGSSQRIDDRRCRRTAAGRCVAGTVRIGLTDARQRPGPRAACGSACTCARSRTSTGRWPGAAPREHGRASASAPRIGRGPTRRAAASDARPIIGDDGGHHPRAHRRGGCGDRRRARGVVAPRRQRRGDGATPVGVAVQRSVVEPAGPGAPGPALDLRDRARSCRSS